ncbi:leishmanolysin-like peptidase, partial [Plakobranchus ocellatus]
GCMYYLPYTQNYLREPTVSSGVRDADFILYVATIPSGKCRENQTIAYAAHCQQEDGLDRPVAGYFSLCPNSISLSRQNRQQLLSTMKHEILHALGFTAGLYAFYRDDNGNPRTARDPNTGRPPVSPDYHGMYQWSTSTIREVVRANWIQKSGVTERRVRIMVTPRVRDEVRQHFNCSSLEGAELEDQGIDGTALTHWEKRVFENEAMTGTYTQNSVISRITMAMMEDTGWYKADYSQAGDYEWGKNLGCEFVQNSCYNWISSRHARGESIHPFCDQVKRGELWTDCSLNRHSVALCNLVEYQRNMPAKFQYFDKIPGVPTRNIGRYAGSVQLADYCPYLQEFSWTDEANVPVRGSNCKDPHNNLDSESNFFGEEYGDNSLCFEHASRWYMRQCNSVRSPQHAGSGCYKFSCDLQHGLSIHLHNQTYRCYHEKQVINVIFASYEYVHHGTVVCPSCREICGDSITCPPEKAPPPSSQPRRVTNIQCSRSTNLSPAFTLTILVPLLVFFLHVAKNCSAYLC